MNTKLATRPGTVVETNPGVPARVSALHAMANRVQVEPAKLLGALKATVFKGATDEELLALVVVANQYGLNPFLKEIYAFPKKGGGIVPMVPIDGWTKIVNRQEDYDGCRFEWELEAETSQPISCTCLMRVKNRSEATEVTEYFDECYRETDPWKKMPKRMLRHKAYMQAARLAFGLSGIVDEDEAADVIADQMGRRGRIVNINSEPMTGPGESVDRDDLQKTAVPGQTGAERQVDTSPAQGPANPNGEGIGPDDESASGGEQTPPSDQEEIAAAMHRSGFSFDQLRQWCISQNMGRDQTAWQGFGDIDQPTAKHIRGSIGGVVTLMRRMFAKGVK